MVECERFCPVLKGGGGGQKVLDMQFSHFVAAPLPVFNDQSLIQMRCLATLDGCKY